MTHFWNEQLLEANATAWLSKLFSLAQMHLGQMRVDGVDQNSVSLSSAHGPIWISPSQDRSSLRMSLGMGAKTFTTLWPDKSPALRLHESIEEATLLLRRLSAMNGLPVLVTRKETRQGAKQSITLEVGETLLQRLSEAELTVLGNIVSRDRISILLPGPGQDFAVIAENYPRREILDCPEIAQLLHRTIFASFEILADPENPEAIVATVKPTVLRFNPADFASITPVEILRIHERLGRLLDAKKGAGPSSSAPLLM